MGLFTGWWFGTFGLFFMFHSLGIIIRTDLHIFQRSRYTTNQFKCTNGCDLSMQMAVAKPTIIHPQIAISIGAINPNFQLTYESGAPQ